MTELRVGVTGHRVLDNAGLIRRSVEQVLGELDTTFGGEPHGYRAVSPLAEGADRLVAKCVLEWKGSAGCAVLLPPSLEVVLPLPAAEYVKTFNSGLGAESIREFKDLLAQAASVQILPGAGTRREAYERAGRYVVGNCGVLIAIWDGETARGKGGTADIVEFARSNRRAIFWIELASGKIHRLNLEYL